MKFFFQSLKEKYGKYKHSLLKGKNNSPININSLIKIIFIAAPNNNILSIKIIMLPLFLIGYFSSRIRLTNHIKLISLCSVYYLMTRYFYYFSFGHIKKAYFHKKTALNILLLHCTENRKSQIEMYFSIINNYNFNYSENESNIVKPLFNSANRCPLKVAIFGAKTTQSQLDQAKKYFDKIVIIKPRYDLDIENGFVPKQVILYYNNGDTYRNKVKIAEYISRKKTILTPNKYFEYKNIVCNPIFFTKTFFSASPLALHVIINTVILMGATKIKLFGFDFYMGDNIYPDTYYSSLKQHNNSVDNRHFLESLARHDILFNFQLLKKLILQHNIELDENLAYIKTMTLEKYLELFENKYGAYSQIV